VVDRRLGGDGGPLPLGAETPGIPGETGILPSA
jgi:hypothetical protein